MNRDVVARMQRVAAWLGAACVGLVSNSLVLAHQAKPRTILSEKHTVFSVAFSPDGKTLASGSRDKTIKLWDIARGKQTASLLGHTGGVASVAFSPDGKTLASGE